MSAGLEQGGTPVTSLILRDGLRSLAAGNHLLLTGRVSDLVMVRGRLRPLAAAYEELLQSSFELVATVDLVDGVRATSGQDHLNRLIAEAVPMDQPRNEPIDERQTRIRAATAQLQTDPDDLEIVGRLLTQRDVATAIVIDQADLLLPRTEVSNNRRQVALFHRALLAQGGRGAQRNVVVLLSGQPGDLPPILTSACETLHQLDVPPPCRRERRAAWAEVAVDTHRFGELDYDSQETAIEELVRLGEGDSLVDVRAQARLSAAIRLPIDEPRQLVQRYRHQRTNDHWTDFGRDLDRTRKTLEAKVLGQPQAIDRVMQLLSARSMGLNFSGEGAQTATVPMLLFFAGPTGVGKTELSKAIAAAVYGDSRASARIDMSTFSEAHSGERLTGSPPGYVGHEEGGELTNALLRNPQSVVVLDEFEKAHPDVQRRFLSILDDGHLTDAQGHAVHFGDALIIMTSNLGATDLVRATGEQEPNLAQVATILNSAIERHFVNQGLPELYGRIKRGIVAFDLLRHDTVAAIAEKFAQEALFHNGPELSVDIESARAMAQTRLMSSVDRRYGGREIRNLFQRYFEVLAGWLAEGGHGAAQHVHAVFGASSLEVSVDGGQPIWVEVEPSSWDAEGLTDRSVSFESREP